MPQPDVIKNVRLVEICSNGSQHYEWNGGSWYAGGNNRTSGIDVEDVGRIGKLVMAQGRHHRHYFFVPNPVVEKVKITTSVKTEKIGLKKGILRRIIHV